MRTTEQKFNALFSELVPVTGKADTVAGEIIRAVSRISYRYYNDGDRIGIGYGKETCNPAARYLIKHGGDEVAVIVRGMWGMDVGNLYDKAVEMLKEAAIAYIEQHPELKTTPNDEDIHCNPDGSADITAAAIVSWDSPDDMLQEYADIMLNEIEIALEINPGNLSSSEWHVGHEDPRWDDLLTSEEKKYFT